MRRLSTIIPVLILIAVGSQCKQVALFERLQNVDNASWQSAQIPELKLTISDTVSTYNVFLVIRHTNQYAYRNLWLNVGVKQPADTAFKYQPFNVQLAANDRWLGNGMDDIFENRQLLFPQPVKFSRVGDVTFSLQHTMRQNPLPGVLQVGIRIEKK